MKSMIIGRDKNCNYVIYDPKKRVSRRHLEIVSDKGKFFIKDIGSTNGTFLNGKKMPAGILQEVQHSDKITLSFDYILDLRRIIPVDEDRTLHLNQGRNEQVRLQNNKAIYTSHERVVEFDRDKTTIGEILEVDDGPYKIIGRDTDCHFSINDSNISRQHCRIRLLSHMIIEIEDLGSTNGTFADQERLLINKKYQYDSSVTIRLGRAYILDLRKLFLNIRIVKKTATEIPRATVPSIGAPITKEELKRFAELEELWNEYLHRQNEANNAAVGFGIGGALVGMALGAFTGGIGGVLLSGGGSVLGRYLGQQKSSEIRQDLNYETAFLETYCCPRCKESFQKKPWITIRDCLKCKLKFRQ